MSGGAPHDAPHGSIEGPHPLHVLVVGGLSGSAIGVPSFRLGVANRLANALARSTGRGVDWESIAHSDACLAAAGTALRSLEGLASFDVVVLSPGTADLLAFTPFPVWRDELTKIVDLLSRATSARAAVLVIKVPDVSAHVLAGPVVSTMVSEDARSFTEIAARVCERWPKAHFVALPEVEEADFVDGAYSYARLYQRWSNFLGEFFASRLA
jgi:hypothetical protein